jgi:hypothetical protein
MLNTKHVMQTQGHMNHTISQELPVGMLRNRLCVPLFLAGVFDSEELHMLSRAHKNRLSSCRLAATWAAGLAELLVEGLARGLAFLGAGLAEGLALGSRPCGKHNLGRHNTAPRTLEIDSTSWVRVNIINIHG